jgi:hypothetical protein
MRTLELFAGSRSFSKVALKRGHSIFTTDLEPFDKIDLVANIFDLDLDDVVEKMGGKPHVIWSSPPCTTFSIASCYRHWNKDRTPKTERCKEGIRIIERTIEIIKELNPMFYFIENPRGMLRKQKMMEEFTRYTITYCKYGDDRMKPTDIWTNMDWKPRPMCKRSERHLCHHIPSPRGSSTGTQGYANAYQRSKIPEDLFHELFDQMGNLQLNAIIDIWQDNK